MGNTRSQLGLPTRPGIDELPLWLWCVVQYSSWKERGVVLSLNRPFSGLQQNDKFWRLLITRLAVDHGVYVPSVLPSMERSWRHLFFELYSQRGMWTSTTDNSDIAGDDNTTQRERNERFKVSVFCRFRPLETENQSPSISEDSENESGHSVTLPLHQRLSMIRMSGKAATNREALRVLASEGEWFQKKWSSLVDNKVDTETETEQVQEQRSVGGENVPPVKGKNESTSKFLLEADASIKLRKGERQLDQIKKNQEKMVARVQSLDPGMGRVVMVAPDVGLREFSFDGVMPLNSTQSSVYDLTTRRLVMDFVNGYNATCIAFGQTSSGKSVSQSVTDPEKTTTDNLNP